MVARYQRIVVEEPSAHRRVPAIKFACPAVAILKEPPISRHPNDLLLVECAMALWLTALARMQDFFAEVARLRPQARAAGNRELKRYKARDPAAIKTIQKIRRRKAKQGRVSDESYAHLVDLEHKYPYIPNIRDHMSNTYWNVVCENLKSVSERDGDISFEISKRAFFRELRWDWNRVNRRALPSRLDRLTRPVKRFKPVLRAWEQLENGSLRIVVRRSRIWLPDGDFEQLPLPIPLAGEVIGRLYLFLHSRDRRDGDETTSKNSITLASLCDVIGITATRPSHRRREFNKAFKAVNEHLREIGAKEFRVVQKDGRLRFTKTKGAGVITPDGGIKPEVITPDGRSESGGYNTRSKMRVSAVAEGQMPVSAKPLSYRTLKPRNQTPLKPVHQKLPAEREDAAFADFREERVMAEEANRQFVAKLKSMLS